MENKNQKNKVIVLLIMLYPLSLFLNIPLIYNLSYKLKFAIQIVSFIVFLWILFKTTNWKTTTFQISILILSLTIYLNDYDRKIFMGEPIATAYTADVPGGYEHLELFENNKCSLNMGLITSETYYGYYKVNGESIICFLEGKLWDLENMKIHLNNKSYLLKNPSKK